MAAKKSKSAKKVLKPKKAKGKVKAVRKAKTASC